MNLAVLSETTRSPSGRLLMERALEPHLLIGMPHLTPGGLSETWLMKELGHRHWLMLARHLGMVDADFRTPDGAEAYAAICATALSDADFGAVGANDVLTIRSTLYPLGRMRTSTRHRLSVGDRPVGTVELVSVFVTRSRDGDNRSIMRTPSPPGAAPGHGDSALARTAAALRAATLRTHFGLPLDAAPPLRTFAFEPDPLQEFNGAGLFYFAEFQAVAERAFRHWFGETPAIAARQVFFSGNICPGETLSVELSALSPDTRTALCCLRREDGKAIASIFARR